MDKLFHLLTKVTLYHKASIHHNYNWSFKKAISYKHLQKNTRKKKYVLPQEEDSNNQENSSLQFCNYSHDCICSWYTFSLLFFLVLYFVFSLFLFLFYDEEELLWLPEISNRDGYRLKFPCDSSGSSSSDASKKCTKWKINNTQIILACNNK